MIERYSIKILSKRVWLSVAGLSCAKFHEYGFVRIICICFEFCFKLLFWLNFIGTAFLENTFSGIQFDIDAPKCEKTIIQCSAGVAVRPSIKIGETSTDFGTTTYRNFVAKNKCFFSWQFVSMCFKTTFPSTTV